MFLPQTPDSPPVSPSTQSLVSSLVSTPKDTGISISSSYFSPLQTILPHSSSSSISESSSDNAVPSATQSVLTRPQPRSLVTSSSSLPTSNSSSNTITPHPFSFFNHKRSSLSSSGNSSSSNWSFSRLRTIDSSGSQNISTTTTSPTTFPNSSSILSSTDSQLLLGGSGSSGSTYYEDDNINNNVVDDYEAADSDACIYDSDDLMSLSSRRQSMSTAILPTTFSNTSKESLTASNTHNNVSEKSSNNLSSSPSKSPGPFRSFLSNINKITKSASNSNKNQIKQSSNIKISTEDFQITQRSSSNDLKPCLSNSSTGSNGPSTVSHGTLFNGRASARQVTANRDSLKPKVKSFLRISRDLQDELSPLDYEIKQEARITMALRDETFDEPSYFAGSFKGLTSSMYSSSHMPPISSAGTSSSSSSSLVSTPKTPTSISSVFSVSTIKDHYQNHDNSMTNNSPLLSRHSRLDSVSNGSTSTSSPLSSSFNSISSASHPRSRVISSVGQLNEQTNNSAVQASQRVQHISSGPSTFSRFAPSNPTVSEIKHTVNSANGIPVSSTFAILSRKKSYSSLHSTNSSDSELTDNDWGSFNCLSHPTSGNNNNNNNNNNCSINPKTVSNTLGTSPSKPDRHHLSISNGKITKENNSSNCETNTTHHRRDKKEIKHLTHSNRIGISVCESNTTSVKGNSTSCINSDLISTPAKQLSLAFTSTISSNTRFGSNSTFNSQQQNHKMAVKIETLGSFSSESTPQTTTVVSGNKPKRKAASVFDDSHSSIFHKRRAVSPESSPKAVGLSNVTITSDDSQVQLGTHLNNHNDKPFQYNHNNHFNQQHCKDSYDESHQNNYYNQMRSSSTPWEGSEQFRFYQS